MVFQVNPSKLPTADSIKSLLFPTVMATEVDGQGLKIYSRAAFPNLTDPSRIGSVSQLTRTIPGMGGMPGMGGPPMPPGLAPPPTAPPLSPPQPGAGRPSPGRGGNRERP